MGICFSKTPAVEKKKTLPLDFTKIDPTSYRQKTSAIVVANNGGVQLTAANIQKRPSIASAASSRVSNTNLKYHLQELNNSVKTRSNTTASKNDHLATFDDATTTSSNITRSTASASSASSSSAGTVSTQEMGVSRKASQPSSKNAYVALFDYDSRTNQDLSFKKGDVLYIFDEDKKANGWWLAKLRDGTQQQGYIPSQYVAQLDSLESQPWYFGQIKRMEAEKLLLNEPNRNGSFLVRISDGNSHAYSLSVRDGDTIKHYRVQMNEGKFFITKKTPFTLLAELIAYYIKSADGLCVQLTVPCVKRDKPITKGLTHSFMRDHEMDRTKFRLDKKIGQGQFGDVWRAEYIESGLKVAIKTLKEGMNPTDFRAEAELMRNLYHPKLIQLYALCTKEEPIYIVTELMVNGSLLDYLQTPVGKRLPLDMLIYIAAQIADGMAYLESHNYIHRDLAARNVLVGENNQVKVADFGLARVIKDVSTIYSAREGTKFPIKWTAPEAAIYNKFSIKSDVWSFGIVLTEIITHGRTPYPSMSNQEVLQQVSRGYRMQQPPNCADKLYAIMVSCWKQNAEDRPTFEALKYKLDNYFDEDDNRQYRDTNNPNSNSNGMR